MRYESMAIANLQEALRYARAARSIFQGQHAGDLDQAIAAMRKALAALFRTLPDDPDDDHAWRDAG